MPTLPSGSTPRESFHAREAAESFGADAQRYDRTRPRYPAALIDRLLTAAPGGDVLDVGIGTGVSARPFRAAGCRVLGVEVDPRMAAFARTDGFEVEVARFEDWDPRGRSFDLVAAGMTWHWIEPRIGAAKAGAVLRPSGRLALFWNVGRPRAQLARAFAAVYARVLPDTPYGSMPSDPLAAYEPILTRTVEGIRATRTFREPERLRVDWEQRYTTEEWLDQVPTFGGHSRFPPAVLRQLLDGIAAAIEGVGGSFTMNYAAVAVTAFYR